ncbi:class I SAM-dependent methyltransferase [Euzebya rosea]|uniref:class I SAM-dependent methyltransferase n=1 Tax=Euzebya rosea TaxID=2052804 RepID=UPI0013006CE0|nr:class I SAM-dependent methyltransferase [Euzebya rosea]
MTGFSAELCRRTLERAAAFEEDQRIAVLGATPAGRAVTAALVRVGLGDLVTGLFDDEGIAVTSMADLPGAAPTLLVIAHDDAKEAWLLRARDLLDGQRPPPDVVIAGTGHLAFNDERYARLDAPALVPSYATGSPHTRHHIYNCLTAAATAGLDGAIVEFGAFKGGTTAWMARVASDLGIDGPVIGFDTWDGFPARRSLLDLYEHPRCVFGDLDAVRAYTAPYGVELVAGDITETFHRLAGMPLLLSFFDTDNYSPARAALELCADQTVVGGSIVLDHVATLPDYVDTVGERIAAAEVLDDRPFLHLHDTGVYTRIR